MSVRASCAGFNSDPKGEQFQPLVGVGDQRRDLGEVTLG
jgi:hypothetical protein